jgi:hypothetical protein
VNKRFCVSWCLNFELFALAIGSFVACVVGVSSQYRYQFASREFFDLMAWPVVAVPSIICLILVCTVYCSLRRSKLRWILFGVAGLTQLLLGGFVGRWMNF